jgi:hypothetical protein
MLRLTEVASQSETFVKPALQKAKTSREANGLIGPPRANGSKCFPLTGRLYWLLYGFSGMLQCPADCRLYGINR